MSAKHTIELDDVHGAIETVELAKDGTEMVIDAIDTLAHAHAHAQDDEAQPDPIAQLKPWQQTIIRELRNIPNVTRACRMANRTSTDSAYKSREDDELFRRLWDEALEGHTDAVEESLYDIAVNGHERTHFGKDGEVKGKEKVRDVNAIKFWLAGNRPKTYRETHGPLVNINVGQVEDALGSALENGVLRDFFDRKLTEKRP